MFKAIFQHTYLGSSIVEPCECEANEAVISQQIAKNVSESIGAKFFILLKENFNCDSFD